MMTIKSTLKSVVTLTPALWAVGALSQVAQAASSDYLSLQQQHEALQSAVCSNDWHTALTLIGPMIATPDITPNYRQQLVSYRHRLEAWRTSQVQFQAMPGCGREVVFSQPDTQSPPPLSRLLGIRSQSSSSTALVDQTAQQLRTELGQAVCQNNWNEALRVVQPLIGSASVDATEREDLIRLRHQIEDWRATRSVVSLASRCDAIATAESSPIEWH